MTEGQLLGRVALLAGQLGLLWHHCGRSERCQGPAGFPDLVIVGPHGLIVAELKSDDGSTSAEQDLWLWTLMQSQGGPHLWRPADLKSGYIERLLRGIA